MTKALLVLEDGTCFEGKSFGSSRDAYGKAVFNTSMAGYQEIMTDPSSKGQILIMTYPLIGNYGFNNEDNESSRPKIHGLVVKELCDTPSNWRNSGTPIDYFLENDVAGICDIDTRRLTQHIRDNGSMYGVITTRDEDISVLAQKAKEFGAEKHDYVKEVTVNAPLHIEGTGKKLAVLDFGVENSIKKELARKGFDIYIMPACTNADEILNIDPDGIILSNGPGSPDDIPYAIDTVKKLTGKKPMLGIGLGHLVLGKALGGSIETLKYGRHGNGNPVTVIKTGKVIMTSQNNDYVLKDDIPDGIIITHINFNDKTIAGFACPEKKLAGIQFYPLVYTADNELNALE